MESLRCAATTYSFIICQLCLFVSSQEFSFCSHVGKTILATISDRAKAQLHIYAKISKTAAGNSLDCIQKQKKHRFVKLCRNRL